MEIRLSASLLAWLRCFDAAARHGSFTKAAAELCITQGAVSQQVKHLEDWLHRPLFLRTPRALVPTPEGQWLAVVLREGFTAIENTLSQMRQPQETPTATLSCSPSFAMSWLTPRLGDFFASTPAWACGCSASFTGWTAPAWCGTASRRRCVSIWAATAT